MHNTIYLFMKQHHFWISCFINIHLKEEGCALNTRLSVRRPLRVRLCLRKHSSLTKAWVWLPDTEPAHFSGSFHRCWHHSGSEERPAVCPVQYQLNSAGAEEEKLTFVFLCWTLCISWSVLLPFWTKLKWSLFLTLTSPIMSLTKPSTSGPSSAPVLLCINKCILLIYPHKQFWQSLFIIKCFSGRPCVNLFSWDPPTLF